MTNDRSEALRIIHKLLCQLGADHTNINVVADNVNICISIPPFLVRTSSSSDTASSLLPKITKNLSKALTVAHELLPKMTKNQPEALCGARELLNQSGAGACTNFMPGKVETPISVSIPISLVKKLLGSKGAWSILSKMTKDQSEAPHKITNDQPEALRITHELLNQLGADRARINVTADDKDIRISIPLPLVTNPFKSEAATKTLITLRGGRDPALWNLLTGKYSSNLENLCVISGGDFPRISLHPSGLGPRYRLLTSFTFKSSGSDVTASLGQHLLEFLGNCPNLEVLFLSHCNPKQVIQFGTSLRTTKFIHLNFLRSFTHESCGCDEATPVPVPVPVPVSLFNRLLLKTTCEVTFKIRCLPKDKDSWDRSFPAPLRDAYHLSRVHTVKITVRPEVEGPVISSPDVVGATFLNSDYKFSFNATIFSHKCPRADGVENILDFLERCEAVKTLHFERCIEKLDVKTVLELVKDIVVRRRERGTPLKFVVLDVQFKERFEEVHRESIKELEKYVSVEVGLKDPRV